MLRDPPTSTFATIAQLLELKIEKVTLLECIDWVLANMREEIEARNAKAFSI